MKCQEPFNALTRRRHHCRACGFVSSQSDGRSEVPLVGRRRRLLSVSSRWCAGSARTTRCRWSTTETSWTKCARPATWSWAARKGRGRTGRRDARWTQVSSLRFHPVDGLMPQTVSLTGAAISSRAPVLDRRRSLILWDAPSLAPPSSSRPSWSRRPAWWRASCSTVTTPRRSRDCGVSSPRRNHSPCAWTPPLR